MGTRDFLLEIGLEEIPARFVNDALAQLATKLKKFLEKQEISYADLFTYATPRRLAVMITEMNEKQADRFIETKGPAKKIAINEQGDWTKAAQGFAKSQGVSLQDLRFKEVKGIEYVHAYKEVIGEETQVLLPQLKELITELSFPKNMRWGTNELRFVRPLRWIVCLYGSEVIPFEIAGIHSGKVTQGHRFLGSEITVDAISEYPKLLHKEYVIASVEERRKMITDALKELEGRNEWSIPLDKDLLEEVTHLVEYPTAVFGTFDQQFLDIPSEVLITSMKEHQRYFPVYSQAGELLPYFVTIRNGLEDDQGIIAKGNEKVLRARLADARFFYEEDKKLDINQAVSQLENIVFHEELGTVGDKVRRVREIALALGKKLNVKKELLVSLGRSAEICKFDLVSQMVNEFPELQGIMGEKYAQLAGEDAEVCLAIREHYLPRFSGDRLPSSTLGAILSVADKMDTIAGCFGIGISPSGSQDPYALRRQATGIVQIMLDQGWPLTLAQIFDLALQTLTQRQLLKNNVAEVRKDLDHFFFLRLKNRMQEEQIRYDIIDAVLYNYTDTKLDALLSKSKVIMDQLDNDSCKPTMESFTRVTNLAKKLDKDIEQINPEYFESDIEHELFEVWQHTKQLFEQAVEDENWSYAYTVLTNFKAPIDRYFDQVMVMTEDEQVRYNRLALLREIASLIHRFADVSQIIFSSAK